MGLLQLRLARVPNVVGIYGASKSLFPARMAYLNPEAVAPFLEASKKLGLRVSDMYRTAEESLLAMQKKTGVQPPGFSAHNYGFAIDIDVDAALKTNKLSKAQLDLALEESGWWCHRKDSLRGMEDWHYNYLGKGAEAARFLAESGKSTNRSAAVAAKIVAVFGDQLRLTAEEAQIALTKMRLYSGEIDGIWGGGSRQALTAFQRAWLLQTNGKLDNRTERTLAYVTADVQEVTAPAVTAV